MRSWPRAPAPTSSCCATSPGVHPGVLFLPVVHGPREATLHRPAPNLFRFAGDYGQGVAGLGTYAYRDLGWRRAAIALSHLGRGLGRAATRSRPSSAPSAAGSRSQLPRGLFEPAGRDVERLRADVDGVAVFAGRSSARGFLKATRASASTIPRARSSRPRR